MSRYIRVWTSAARWRYMHTYRKTLEKAVLKIGKEKGKTTAKPIALISSYVQGILSR